MPAERRTRASRVLTRLAPGFVAGMIASLGLAPFNAVWLALPGFTLGLHLLLRDAGPRQGFVTGWAFGSGYFALALFWIVDPFFVDAARDGWMAPFALVFLAGGLALFWGAAFAVAARFQTGATRLAAAVLALTLAELARTYVLTGFPWALVGHAWIGWPVMQIAAWGGAGLLTLLVLVPAALAARLRPAGIAAALALVAAAAALGSWRQSQPLPTDHPQVVRIVQPNVPQSLKWDAAKARDTLARLVQLSAKAPVPALVVWPETALPYLYEAPGPLTRDIAAAVGRPMLIGAIRADGPRAYNSLIELRPNGTVAAIYDKHHLVPFGEYLPFGAILSRIGLKAFTAQEGYGYTAGPGPALIDLGVLGKVLPLICYEAIFPQDLRGTTRPDWLFQATNDAWFGRFSGPYQHLAQARLRAVEQGLPLLRAANTGVSAVIDAHGTVRSALALGQSGVIDTALPGALPETLYARTGDLPLAVLLGVLLAGLALRTLRIRD